MSNKKSYNQEFNTKNQLMNDKQQKQWQTLLYSKLARPAFFSLTITMLLSPTLAWAQNYSQASFRFFRFLETATKNDKPLAGQINPEKQPQYGIIKLDMEIFNHAGFHDIRPFQADKPLAYFSRLVSLPDPEQYYKPKVVFQQNNDDQMVVILELPQLSSDLEYKMLVVNSSNDFETSVEFFRGNGQGNYIKQGVSTLLSYGSIIQDKIRFQGDSSRFFKLVFNQKHEFSFPLMYYGIRNSQDYYTKKLDRRQWQIEQDSNNQISLIRIDSGIRYRIDAIKIGVSSSRYDREFFISSLNDEQGHNFYIINQGHLRSRLAEKKPTFKTENKSNIGQSINIHSIDLPQTIAQHLRVEIHNGDNFPLEIVEVWLVIPIVEIVFQLPKAWKKSSDALRLYYSNDYAQPPNFDLEHFFSPQSVSQIFTVGSQQSNPDYGYSLIEPPLSIWIIRILLIAVLLLLVFPVANSFIRSRELVRNDDL